MDKKTKNIIIISSIIMFLGVFIIIFLRNKYSSNYEELKETKNEEIINEENDNREINDIINDNEEIMLGDCSAGCASGSCLTGCGYYNSSGTCVAPTYICSSCKAGYKLSSGSCTQCSGGTYSSAGATSCTSCSAGYYSGSGASSCTACSDGYISGSGASSCTQCNVGYTSNSDHTSCIEVCSAGYYPNSSGTCSPCEKGYYCPDGTGETKCAAGTYQDEEGQTSCKDCAAGYYQDETGKTSCKTCSGDTQYQNETGQASCKTCLDRYLGYSNPVGGDAHTECKKAPIRKVELIGRMTKAYITPKESLDVQAYASGYITNVIVDSWSLKTMTDLEGFKISNTDSYAYATVSSKTNLDTGTNTTCKWYKSQITAKNDNTPSEVSSKNIEVCVYCQDWVDYSGYWQLDTGPKKSSAKFKSGCIFYTESDNGKYYSQAHVRCCGVKPPPNNYGYCYGDEPYIGIATDNPATKPVWIHSEDEDAATSDRPFKYPHSMVPNEDECHAYNSGIPCTAPEKQIESKEAETTKCEVDVDSASAKMELENSEIKCSAGGNFYTIKCNKTVNTGFDYGSDGSLKTSTELFKGQGYKYKITVKTTTSCKAYFYPEVWKKAYNLVMDKMKKVWSISEGGKTAYEVYVETRTKNKPEIYEAYIDHLLKVDKHTTSTASYVMTLYRTAKEIEELVDMYNNYPLDDDYDETATLKMEYTANKKPVTLETTFIKDKETEETPKTTKLSSPHNLGLSWLTNPVDYKWEKTREVELIPKNSYIKTDYGEVTDFKIETIDGGNKVYIDYDADIGNIPISIEVNGLGGNKSKSKVKNEKCSVTVKDTIIKYREVDVKNPFINSTWPRADNWLNTQYDFTKIIKENVWNKKAEKTIAICKEKVSTLQSSTASYMKNQSKPYLGICSTLKSSMQDPITKRLCSAISSDSNYENICK